jgi:hypothetical protein
MSSENESPQKIPNPDLTIDEYTSEIFVQDLKRVLCGYACIPQFMEDMGALLPVERVNGITTADACFTASSVDDAFHMRKEGSAQDSEELVVDVDQESVVNSSSAPPGSIHSLNYESFGRKEVLKCDPLSRCFDPNRK